MPRQQLYLTLPSNSNDYDDNTTSNFRARLPNPIELGGDGSEWECGLAQIDYPNSFDNVTGERTKIGMRENMFFVRFKPNSVTRFVPLLEKVGENVYTKEKEGPSLRLRFVIPVGSYDTIDGLVEAINRSIKKTEFTPESIKPYNSSHLDAEKMLNWFETAKATHDAPIYLQYNKDTRRVHFILKWGIKDLLFSEKLHYILGISSERWVQFSSSEFITEYPPDLTAGFNTLFVYCNLIEPQIVGSSLLSLLRTVSIKGKQGDFISEIFQSPHYVRVQTKTFDTVEIALKNDLNEYVRFNYGKVIVKLHLRQISVKGVLL